MVPSKDTENGSLFRGDYCFDSDSLECPLFNMCSLVLKGKNVVAARLNTSNIDLLPKEVQTDLTRTVLDPLLNIKAEKPYTISSLNEAALCTKEKELDPLFNKPKPKIIIPPMPEEPPSTLEDIEPIKETETNTPETNSDILQEEPEQEPKPKEFNYIAKGLPGFFEEPPPENPDFELEEENEIHPFEEPEEGSDGDIGINTKTEKPSDEQITPPMPEPKYEKDDDNDGYEYSWQKYH
jgi:hypothetical protein